MIDGLKKKVQENPILNDYYEKLESIGFEVYNITENAIGPIILAQRKDELLNELELFMNPKSKLVDIEIKNRLVWQEYKELSVPCHNVQMKIQGAIDYEYNDYHDFTLWTTTEKTNIELNSLKDQLNPSYEKIARTTNSSIYFEREKANFVKEIFRINFVDNDIKYYEVNYETTIDDIKKMEPSDTISFTNNQEILEYIYGG